MWAMMNDMGVMTDPAKNNENCKLRSDSELENSGNQVLEAKMPFYLLWHSLSAHPVSVLGLALSTRIPRALRTAERGTQWTWQFSILISLSGVRPGRS